MENGLVKLVNDSGLDKTKSQVLLENFSNYFEIASDWENKAKMLVITSVEQKAEMKMAREGRLFLKEKRIAVEKTRRALKENALREGQTIDAIAKVLTNLIVPIEKDLEEKEKFAEIQEAKRIEALNDLRAREIEPYIEFVPYGIEFGKISEEDYQKLLSGAKLQKKAKEEAERKAEEERIAKEKAVQLHNERKDQLLPYWNFIPVEHQNDDFSTFTDEEWMERLDWCKSEKQKDDDAKEAQRIENERLKAEADAKEKQLMAERAKADAERREHERQLQIQRDKQAKLEAERRAELERIEAERKAREDAERKAKSAPDKEKLHQLAKKINELEMPEVSSEEAIRIIENVTLLLNKTAKYIIDQSENI